MKEGRISHLNKKDRGQAMVEFVISLPLLLFILFGIIEFARLTFAWMAVQNAARFGVRFAVTGEFNDVYCVEAGNYLGATHINADVHGGDPQDCSIPDTFIPIPPITSNDLERELIDLARLHSIQDATIGGGTGLWLRPNVSGNYEQYLANHNDAFIGLPDEEGFYHVTICSNRNNQFAMDFDNYAIPLCMDLSVAPSELMDDAGGPGDRVKVHVEHEHPFFLPLLSNIWPSVTLNAERDGIVEKFRTSRVIGVSGPILSAPTWTQTPTITPTPTDTPTTTPSLTPTITETPIPVDCDFISIDHSSVGPVWSGYYGARITISNNNPVPIHLFQANHDWEVLPPSRRLWAAWFNGSPWAIFDDDTPPTTWDPAPPIKMDAGDLGDYVVLFKPVAEPVQGALSVDLVFDDNCHKGFSTNLPTSTPTPTPTITSTPTITPTPDCSLYSMTGFSFNNMAIQEMWITNGDVVDATVSQIQLDWNYAEQYGNVNGYPNLNVDWFSWNGFWFSLDGQNGAREYNSPTSWISGSLPFNSGSTYNWDIDFDSDWGWGGSLTPDVINSDFGVIIDFTNGCQLRRDAVPRPVISWTPSPTPTHTWTPTPIPPPTDTPEPTSTFTPSVTPLPTFTFTPSWTPSITPTASDTPIPTSTFTPTNTPITPTATNTPIPSDTPEPSATFTPLPTNTPTETPIPTWTPACPFDDPNWPCQPTWTPSP
jgi:hypothetical protein